MSVNRDVNHVLTVWREAGYEPTMILCTADWFDTIYGLTDLPVVLCTGVRRGWEVVTSDPWSGEDKRQQGAM